MRIARLQTVAGARHAVSKDGAWHHIDDPFADTLRFTGGTTPAEGAKLLAPVRPAAIVGIGHNDGDHPLPVQAWHKSVHTLANPEEPIQVARGIGTVNVEGELAVVIGKRAVHLTAANAQDHVLGYTVANDVTNADLGPVDERLFQAKAGTNYTPLGPWIETDIEDPDSVSITVTINGQPTAKSGTFNLPSGVADCLVYVTKWITLEPGDIVMTGAPGTCAAVHPGDRVDIALGGIGTLTNSIL
jgi:2-keto-4-pentenoate hydratase/2-oxohepta-3-ene-1,7-dioic acid hydratase in catechol pathway